MFYLSGNKNGNLIGVVDTDDNIEEFYTSEYLLSTGLEIIRLNKELEISYKFKIKCFEFELINLNGILGWKLKANKGVRTFRNKAYYLGYPVISLEYCFIESTLKSIDLKGMDTSNVITMYNMFKGCKSLTTLDLSNFDTSKVTNMGAMFGYCKSLTSLDLSNFDTSNVTTMYSMFVYCENLTSLDISNFDTSNVTTMYAMFRGCKSLTTLDLSHFDTSNVTNMSHMFECCKNLNNLDLSNFDTSNVTIYNIFRSCSKLGLVYVSSSLLQSKLPSKTIVLVPKSSGIKYDKLLKSKKDIAKYLLMLSNYKVVAYEEE